MRSRHSCHDQRRLTRFFLSETHKTHLLRDVRVKRWSFVPWRLSYPAVPRDKKKLGSRGLANAHKFGKIPKMTYSSGVPYGEKVLPIPQNLVDNSPSVL